jgi:hypothetical protein
MEGKWATQKEVMGPKLRMGSDSGYDYHPSILTAPIEASAICVYSVAEINFRRWHKLQ